MAEWKLAEVLRGGPDQAPGPEEATASLLRRANGADVAALLCLGLRETFFDGKPAYRVAAFADVIRRLALPGPDGDTGAQAILSRLESASASRQ